MGGEHPPSPRAADRVQRFILVGTKAAYNWCIHAYSLETEIIRCYSSQNVFSVNHGIYSFRYKGQMLWNLLVPRCRQWVILRPPCNGGKRVIANDIFMLFVCAT